MKLQANANIFLVNEYNNGISEVQYTASTETGNSMEDHQSKLKDIVTHFSSLTHNTQR